MAKSRLTCLPGRLAKLPPRLVSAPDDRRGRDAQRDAQAWRKWYKTSRWQKLRWSVLVRDLFTCQRCKAIVADTSQLVADHRVRHRGDEAAFWNPANLWTLCKACHDGWKQRQEHGR